MSTRLTTIEDLQTQWQPLLNTISQVGIWFDDLKRNETSDISFEVFIGAEKKRAAGIHASEISGCMRRLVYAIAGIERRLLPFQINVNMRRRFNVGHALHALTQNELSRAVMMFGGGYVEFVDEVRITPATNSFTQTYNIHSSTDGLFTFYDTEFSPYLRMGLEIKTESDPEYTKLKAPRKKHVEQVHIYMRALNIPIMWMLYYNKSSSLWTAPTTPWLITYDKKLEAQLETRIQSAYALAQAGNLPQAEEGMECGWCPFAHDCNPACLLKSRRPAIHTVSL